MSGHTDIDEYNYFDVEDFSVDAFFRSLELQSKFTSSDLEFSFPADLENVPISSCLTSEGFLEGAATPQAANAASAVPPVEGSHEGHSGLTENVTETSITDDNDDDSATAVDEFFRFLQLRSCLLRADDETVANPSSCSRDETDVGHNAPSLISRPQQTNDSNIEEKSHHTLSADDVRTCRDCQKSEYLPDTSNKFNCFSSAWTCGSINEAGSYRAKQQSSAHTQQSESAIEVIATMSAQKVTQNYHSSNELSAPASSADDVDLCKEPELCTVNDDAGTTASKDKDKDKMRCEVCNVELSSKYSFVRHLLTPMHCRRAEGYCTSRPPAKTSNNTDVIQLMSRRKPFQCRVCRFFGDTSSELLYHVTTTSHYCRVKSQRLQCMPCHFAGTCDNIVAHIKSDSHTTLVKQFNRLCVITACKSRRSDIVVCDRTKDKKSCGDCGMKFQSASSLEIHIRRRHTGLRPFTCSVCCKSFCDNSTLKLHYRTAQHRHKCELVLH